jgi:hypothetical protein
MRELSHVSFSSVDASSIKEGLCHSGAEEEENINLLGVGIVLGCARGLVRWV